MARLVGVLFAAGWLSGCAADETSEGTDNFSRLQEAEELWVGALVDDSNGGGVNGENDAGSFAGYELMSPMVEAGSAVRAEMLELLSSKGNYMQGPNACADRDVALEAVLADGSAKLVVGLTCNNVQLTFKGQREDRYMNESELRRLGELAKQTVPGIDASQAYE